MSEIKVSIIIPTYNRAKLIKRSIQSVLDQTYQDFEIIVVDDGSTDDTKLIIEKFDSKKIKYLRHTINLGPAAARNTGIKSAKGKYIAFQDSDDEWLPEKLQKQMDFICKTSPETGVVYSRTRRIKGKESILIPSGTSVSNEGNIHKKITGGNFIALPAVVVKKECFDKSGLFDEDFNHFEDWELLIRISKYFNFKLIDTPLVLSYFTAGGVNEQGLLKEYETTSRILKKHLGDIKNDKNLYAVYQYQIGNLLCQTEKLPEGKEHLRNAVKLDRLNPKYLAAYGISFFGRNIYRIFAATKRSITMYREKRYAKNFR